MQVRADLQSTAQILDEIRVLDKKVDLALAEYERVTEDRAWLKVLLRSQAHKDFLQLSPIHSIICLDLSIMESELPGLWDDKTMTSTPIELDTVVRVNCPCHPRDGTLEWLPYATNPQTRVIGTEWINTKMNWLCEHAGSEGTVWDIKTTLNVISVSMK